MSISRCALCPRLCRVSRKTATPSNGICGMPSAPVLARAALHFGEEPCISGTSGSGTVFFSGCSLRCCFCQNHRISHENYGEAVTVERLAAIFRELEEQGAHNINLVNPTHYAVAIRQALSLYRPRVPVVYNSSGYERVETLRALDGLIDVYLPDLKYVSSALSAALSGAADYFSRASAAILEMARQTGPMTLDNAGLAQRGTMVRHLVLPAHTHDSLAVLDWLAAHKEEVWVSLLFQYTPVVPCPDHPELNRTLTARECAKVWNAMVERGITEGYVQDRKSAGAQYIPSFDLTGVKERAAFCPKKE